MGDLTPRLGIICGMQSETRALGTWADDPKITVAVTGARPERAEEAAWRLVGDGCRILLSWGVAGGLDPALKPGDLIVPAEVVDEDGGRWTIAKTATARLAPPMIAKGALLGVSRIVLTVNEKSRCFAQSGAAAVDMESHLVARVAEAAGIPALAIRAIGDPADQALPELALHALGPNGKVRIGAVVRNLLRRPQDITAVLQTHRNTRRALDRLTAVAASGALAVLSQ